MSKRIKTTTTLVIVESPAKCKKIEEYLGPGYKCIATYGHLRALPSLKNIDIDSQKKVIESMDDLDPYGEEKWGEEDDIIDDDEVDDTVCKTCYHCNEEEIEKRDKEKKEQKIYSVNL